MFVAWLDSLFGRGQCCKRKKLVKPRKKYVRLTDEERANLVTDAWINRMTYVELAYKYDVSQATVNSIIRKAKKARNDNIGV